MSREVWREIEGWAEYSISSAGRVRSEGRVVKRSTGAPQSVRERILRQSRHRAGCAITTVTLTRPGARSKRYVHQLIREAFGTSARED